MMQDIQIILTFLEQVRCGEYTEIIDIPDALMRVETLDYPVDEDPSLNLAWGI